MRKQTLFKKLISSILAAILIIGQFSGFCFVSEAATITTEDGDSMFLSLSKTNKDEDNPIGYANINDKMIWNIMHSIDINGTDEVPSSNIYCIKAEDGETWGTTPEQRVEYNWSETLNKDLGTTPSEEVNALVSGEYFNEILWIIDNLYVPGESDKIEFLEQADIHYDEYDGYVYYSTNGHDYSEVSGVSDAYGEYTLTEDDIIAIQQAAIWYFTNYEDTNYNFRGISSWLKYTTDGAEYEVFTQNDIEQKARDAHSFVVFNYLIDEATVATADLENNTYELEKSTAKLWLSTTEGTDNEEQPVIEVHKIPEEIEKETDHFDLSLRKNITKIENQTLENDRTPVVDITDLYSGDKTTAEYKHRKDAVIVKKGSIVEYNITVYNEGEVNGIATVLKDQLPSGLKLNLNFFTRQGEKYFVTSSKNNIYEVTYNENSNLVTFKLDETKTSTLLNAYTTGENLDKDIISLQCEVDLEADSERSIYLTNIAYIYEVKKADGTIITNQVYSEENVLKADRDSEPYTHPNKTAEELKTIGQIGYTGKNAETELSNSSKYYKGEQDDDDFEKIVILPIPTIVPKIFDLSLRKAIVSVYDKAGNNKNLINIDEKSAERPLEKDGSILAVDTTSLIDGTTATYNHRKDPIVVKKGDIVTYSITIYNEGEAAGYANKIVDKLPGTWNAGLRLENNQTTVTSTTGNVYNVEYQTSTNSIILTIDENSSKKVLEPYDKETQTLYYETILIDCVVMGKADTTSAKVLTNIAYIAEEFNDYLGEIITNSTNTNAQDRDSQTWNSPTNHALLTTDIGYIGNTSNTNKNLSENIYFTGEQDDDDFEKIIIIPESFDLSLRKNITKVNGKAVQNDRTPVEDTKELDAGVNSTTAEYNHRKDAVAVEDEAIVEYNITVYNEGSIDGVATIIRDQLPVGLKLNLNFFTKTGEEYFVTSTKGNAYKVSYDEDSNLVTFQLDETQTVTLLTAHSVGQDLDKDIITLQCEVDMKADDEQNTFLTNIAYIYEAKQEDRTVVTNQVAGTVNGSEADRDSEPYTYPNETAEELKTVGNIGYTGNESNANKDLSQNVYFEGEQDDDDFEKLVILPEAFDLSLRKYITEVDGVTVNRAPDEIITILDNGSSSTAEYNHRKDAVEVKDGSKVEYAISIYNEGAIDGVATIIKDQLPSGLKLNLNYFDKNGEKYFVTSSKGNIYEAIYNEQTNLVEFKLDRTKTTELKYLQAHAIGTKLAEETISLECIVSYHADDSENTYFTNIAYIYEAEQLDGTVVTNQTNGSHSDRDSEPYTYPNETAEELTTVGDIGYTGNENNANKDLSQNVYFEGEQDDDDFEKLVMLPKTFDLKLIKFITELNGEATGNRVISVDTSKLNTTVETTAEYILEKNPVSVKAGDFVTYTLRVYNEGHYDGYATQISEEISKGLEFIVIADGVIQSWDGKDLKDITEEIKAANMYQKIVDVNSNWGFDLESSIIRTNALSEDLLKGFGQKNVQYADTANNIDYAEIQVIFRVKDNVEANQTIRNEAAISQDKAVDNQGTEIDISDRDSSPDEWKKEDSDKTYDENGKWPIYKEDDEDYDNIITKTFDLSLRKQVIQINGVLYTNRYSKLDADNKYSNTLYDYYDVYSNKPKVKAGDKVVYSIRVYNEGEIDGYADLVVDTIPNGLEFVQYTQGDSSINDQYGWTLVGETENLYQTDYLSYEKDENKGTAESTIIKAYDGQGEAHYQEIFIECRVKENATKQDSLLNVAQIAEDSDLNGKDIRDKDSIPGTSDNEEKWKNEDDLDIEILELQEFDLALRKFITAIEKGEKVEEVTTRIPQVTYNKETKQLVYTHTKDALVVHVGDTVIYTLRVYNEGDIAGYASEVKDDIPQYLEYLPEHSTNKENEWVMYDKDGKVTENVEEAVYIKTEHLAKGKGIEADEESKETNLIKAFDPDAEISDENPDYKEVKVAFKVKDPNSTEYEIVNFAQISEDSDSEGNPIDDRDSTPDNGEKEPKEDDEDIEKVKVEYFDLSLIKYVTKVLINENGQERIMETGNVGDENDIIPHVQINKKNIDKTVVKFVYSIKITNEGQIAGEATEITDYVPEGLVFVAEDNEHWTDEGNNVISTKQLTGSTLEPGESVEVEVVLRWINSGDNLGPKTNVAEISEDYNEEDVPDKDSTPDNKVEGEDDIDDATVLLSVNQGGGIQSIYINLTIIFLSIILVGGILIKKFVL